MLAEKVSKIDTAFINAQEATRNYAENAQKATKNYAENDSFGAASKAAQKGMEDIGNAIASFKNGDSLGGASSVLKSMGSFSTAMALAGPAGAVAGMFLSAIMGLVAAILDGMKPPAESLENKIKNIVADQELKNKVDAIKGGLTTWKEEVENRISQLIKQRKEEAEAWENDLSDNEKKIKAGFDWNELPRDRFGSHLNIINTAWQTLQSSVKIHSDMWIVLYESLVSYSLHVWITVENLRGLLRDSKNNEENYEEMRSGYARMILKNICSNYYDSQNEVSIHALWMTGLYSDNPYNSGRGGYNPYGGGIRYNQIYHRIGVIPDASTSLLKLTGGDQFATFAVAESGTIFAGGWHSELYVGRNGTYTKVENCPGCDQVFIAELPGEKIAVACLYNGGSKVCWAFFDDRTGVTGHETGAKNWTFWEKEKRFGEWHDFSVPAEYSILTMAIKPLPPEQFEVYVFALTKGGGGGLFKYAPYNKDILNPVEGEKTTTWRDSGAMYNDTFKVAPAYGRTEVSPVTVTITDSDTFYVQVGNKVHVREPGQSEWVVWDLRGESFFNDSNLKCFKVKAYDDGTLLCATNKGLLVRYNSLVKSNGGDSPQDYSWNIDLWSDKDFQTEWFWKRANRHGRLAIDLINKLREV